VIVKLRSEVCFIVHRCVLGV